MRSKTPSVQRAKRDSFEDQHVQRDGVGNQLTFTDQASKTTTRKYDPVYRLTSVTDALTPAGVTKYAYDPAGNLLSITDANSHVTSFQYDNLNHKVFSGSPGGHGGNVSPTMPSAIAAPKRTLTTRRPPIPTMRYIGCSRKFRIPL